MSAGKIQCLMCSEKIVVLEMLKHVHKHIKYLPMKCEDCNFESIYRNELDDHTFKYDHQGNQSIDTYKQWLVDKINADTIFAAKHGLEELMKQKRNAAPSHSQLPSIQSSTSRAPPRQPRPPPSRRQSSSEDSSSDDDVRHLPTPKATIQRTPSVPRQNNGNRPQTVKKQEESDDDDSDADDKFIEKLRIKPNTFSICHTCREKVKYNLADRQAHVLAKHMAGLPAGMPEQAHRKELEKRTKDAFPGLVSSLTECSKCKKHIQSNGGRISHVANYHFHKKLRCPMDRCMFTSAFPPEFYKHFESVHGMNYKKDLTSQKFHVAVTNQRSKLEAISKLLFTMDFPARASSATPKRKTTTDDDDDDEPFDVEAFLAAAPSKPTQPRVAQKRRRSKSPSSEEEEDSDDEKDGKAESEEDVIEIDDKSEAKSGHGSAASSTFSTAAMTGSPHQSSGRESNRDVKEEIKEEPVTPRPAANNGRMSTRVSSAQTPAAPAPVHTRFTEMPPSSGVPQPLLPRNELQQLQEAASERRQGSHRRNSENWNGRGGGDRRGATWKRGGRDGGGWSGGEEGRGGYNRGREGGGYRGGSRGRDEGRIGDERRDGRDGRGGGRRESSVRAGPLRRHY